MTWIHFISLLGTLVFAISGTLTAIQKRFDLVGSLIIGFVTALGGGTVRDVLIGKTPVGWLTEPNYYVVIIVGYIIAQVFKSKVLRLKKSMFLFDTIGIGMFTILGIQISLEQGLSIGASLLLGVISACFGGVIRDVLTNEVPLIFRREIYATACFIGGAVYIGLSQLIDYENLSIIFSIAVVSVVRYLAIRNHWSLNFNSNPD
ncbi:MAG: trimeric intracellular cation channel family protein [Flavobacteriales bacterium]|nr:trimeric intracellular cation channel family protein [Flavobacteriales bacterium]